MLCRAAGAGHGPGVPCPRCIVSVQHGFAEDGLAQNNVKTQAFFFFPS